ncbi:helix-turn-helix domain-containing protein [Marinimicrobium alkaliphilum]|uniref:helix-turn-helix domain-containing protein n=1 Tax=Marinimicrobium alkaliphilum TaxID=2202654 RepID=UPI000DB9BA7E|nr:AraC family transcriptional regulator [Marinimicrobium alkaliphilum]
MATAVSSICQLVPGMSSADSHQGQLSVPGLALQMLETTGAPGEVPVPPLPQLVLSQALGHAFRYQCDLGAGRFSGQGLPMDFVVVCPNRSTWCRIDDPHSLRFLGIPLPLARRFLARDTGDPLDFGVLHTRHNRDPYIAHTLEALWQELALGDQASALFAETAVASLVIRLQRLSGQVEHPMLTRGGLAAWQSDRVISYMREHLDRPVSLSELAALVDLSPWHFARAFRESHGQPPHRFFVQLRLEKARELLAHSRLPVTDIALRTGYSSQHLARHFRHCWGCTPSDYRRQRQH